MAQSFLSSATSSASQPMGDAYTPTANYKLACVAQSTMERRKRTSSTRPLRSVACCQQPASITDGGSVSGDRKLKESPPRLARGRPQPSAVSFDNRAADREAHAHAVGLRRVE